MKIAALQMNSQPDLEHNLRQAFELVESAAGEGCSLIGLPENFAWLSDERLMTDQVREVSAAVLEQVPQWAKHFGVYVLAGGYPVPAGGDSGKVFNRAQLFGPEGQVLATYDKMHLFDVIVSEEEKYLESGYVQAGEAVPVTARIFDRFGKSSPETKNKAKIQQAQKKPESLTLGLSICYDLRFPELYRALTQAGAELLCVPSAFTQKTGEAHWHTLLRARAIENTAYVIAPAQTGLHGKKRQTYGHALITDPWGRVIAEAADGAKTAVIAEVEPQLLAEIRSKLPCLTHRRLT
ncbi:putative amidohydrolase [Cyclonatronum proteinivorum]|uniref:Putative amidohydrolase n=1 Tax=Cyclonatronum proteinivorum TaxID=1457365 RepID=A0A345UHC2_9BACT|nr:carbon-nitrogen hydrolase family protein [Cyclonatronum proteinivorum]AXI99873.1 putative amidohydrolase [Cyclonatronum proteinivorum]